jgi:tRNA A-37 threonylcarbamoyl transferase component Bud32/predicted nucleotidyltransferase
MANSQGRKIMKLDDAVQAALLAGIGHIAEISRLTAAFVCGSRVAGYARKNSDWNILAVVDEYRPAVRYHQTREGNYRLTILAVDKALFELDCRKGTLGEFVAQRLLAPYEPLKNGDYLHQREIELKSRVAVEEFEDLLLEHGELTRGIVVTPEFLALSHALKRAKVFFPARHSYVRTYSGRQRSANLRAVTPGFEAALRNLEKEGLIHFDGTHAFMQERHVDRLMQRRESERAVNIVELSQRALNSYLMHGRATLTSVETIANELMRTISGEILQNGPASVPEDPAGYLFLKTETGLVAFDEKRTVEEVARKLRPNSPITVEPLGGVLNDVYLVTAGKDHFVAKRFTDWHGFKWFILNLVSLGTKTFALSGKARLSNEYGLSQYLLEHGILVPRIVYASLPERILVKDFIEGKDGASFVRRSVSSGTLSDEQVNMCRLLGERLGAIHRVGTSIGDSKPENFHFRGEGVFVLDLEQGARPGDPAWDVAEFLYYSGHYHPPPLITKGFRDLVRYFIEGYLQEGQAKTLREAGALKYSKVFSIWTAPPVIIEVAQTLRKAS